MAKTLDFNSIGKKYWTVILNDKNKTRLLIASPTKKTMKKILSMSSILDGVEAGEEEEIGILYEVCAEAMSRNKFRTKITAKQLEEIMDIEDVITFFAAYTEFLNEISEQKN